MPPIEARERGSKEILEQIRNFAEERGGQLLIVYRDTGYAGTGHIFLGSRRELVFNFMSTNFDFILEIRDADLPAIAFSTRIDYADQGAIDRAIDLLEREI